jgi:biotin carboxyl carrier protein
LEIRIGGLKELQNVEVVQTAGRDIKVKIDGNSHHITLLKITGNEIEFILDSKYHSAIIQSGTHETKLLIDDHPITVKSHPNLQEILKRSLSAEERGEGGDKDIKSQIPGRVVNIMVEPGSTIKKGDPIIVLESMKMQVAVKSHKDGNVKQIKVNKGATVARYDIVAILE